LEGVALVVSINLGESTDRKKKEIEKERKQKKKNLGKKSFDPTDCIPPP
jgi:hypothetical protein